jgi:hypothetical protein
VIGSASDNGVSSGKSGPMGPPARSLTLLLRVLTKRTQPLINARRLTIFATCGPAACAAVARAQIRLPGQR